LIQTFLFQKWNKRDSNNFVSDAEEKFKKVSREVFKAASVWLQGLYKKA